MNREDFRALLAECELTQRDLAAMMARSPQGVGIWARGAGPVPGYATAFLRAYRLLTPNQRAELRSQLLQPDRVAA